MKPTLLVLAAGIGSRYGGLKQIDEVGPNGEAILDYSVYDALRAGFGKVVFVIRREIEDAFRDKLSRKFEKRVEVSYAFQELGMLPEGYAVPPDRKKPWGTGHAVLTARKHINEPFCVINADDFYGMDSYKVLADFFATGNSPENEHAMVGFLLKKTLSEHGSVARGLCTAKGGYLESVEELTKIEKTSAGARNENSDGSFMELTGNELVSMNMWGFKACIFDDMESIFRTFLDASRDNIAKSEFFIPLIADDLIKRGTAKVKILKTKSSWFGITYRQDKPFVIEKIGQLIKNGDYPAKLWE